MRNIYINIVHLWLWFGAAALIVLTLLPHNHHELDRLSLSIPNHEICNTHSDECSDEDHPHIHSQHCNHICDICTVLSESIFTTHNNYQILASFCSYESFNIESIYVKSIPDYKKHFFKSDYPLISLLRAPPKTV